MPARHPARSTTSDPSGPCCSSIPTARTTTCRSSSRDGARGRGPRSSTQTCSPVCSASTRGSAMTEAPREAELHLPDRARRTGQWSVVSGASRARFHVRDKLVATVHGSRPITGGVVLLSDGGTVMQARLDLDVQGIDTGNRRRDRDLQKPQFLAATTSPSVTVSVTGVTSSATGWTATAVVHARGHSAPLDLAVQTLVVYGELADPPDDEVRIRVAGRLDRAPLGIKVPRMSSSADSSTSRRTWCSAGTGTTSPATTRNCTTGRRCPRERRVPAAGCAGRRTPRRGPRAGRCGRSRQLSARRAAGHRARFRPVTEPPVAPEVRTLTFRRAASPDHDPAESDHHDATGISADPGRSAAGGAGGDGPAVRASDPQAVPKDAAIPGTRYAFVKDPLRDRRLAAPKVPPSQDLIIQLLARFMPRLPPERHAIVRATVLGALHPPGESRPTGR